MNNEAQFNFDRLSFCQVGGKMEIFHINNRRNWIRK